MNDSWIGKDDKSIRDDIVTIAKEETSLTNFKSTGVLRGIVEVIARVVSCIYRTAVNPVYEAATLDGATGTWLSLWGLLMGVVRKQEEAAVGCFTGNSYGAGSVPVGTWIVVEGTDLRYRVTSEVEFAASGSIPLPVVAERPGSAYNIGPDASLRMTRVVPGFDAVSAPDGWPTSLGQDVEQDAAYRERIKARWRSQMLGNVKDTYRYYAESVTGVRSAAVVRAPRGPGSTDVVVSAVNGMPDADLLDAVRQALYDHELLAFDVQIVSPAAIPVHVHVEYSGDMGEEAVRMVAEGYVHALGLGGRFKVCDLYDLYEPMGLETVEILSPARDVVVGESEIVVATVTAARLA